MADRIKYEQLLAFAEGALPKGQADEIEARLLMNRDDARTVERYRLISQRAASDDSVTPSAAALARAMAVFRPEALPEDGHWLSAVERFIARRIFDSRLETVGVRLAGNDDLINLSFETDAAEIDLQAQRQASAGPTTDERWRIMGQINPIPQTHIVHVALARSGSIATVVETAADEHGTFTFSAGPGRYDLHINLPEGVTVLPDIDVK